MDVKHLESRPTVVLAREPSFAIGLLHLFPAARELAVGEEREQLQPQPMKVLLVLARQAGEVVSRDQLIDLCWDGRIVGEDVINRCILLLRGVSTRLGGFQIETVRKSGYRLVVDRGLSSSGPARRWGLAVALIGAIGGLFVLDGRTGQAQPPPVTIELMPFAASPDRLATEVAAATDAMVADMLVDSGVAVLRPGRGLADRPAADFRLSGQVRSIRGKLQATLQLDDLRHETLLLSHHFDSTPAETRELPGRIGAYAATSLATTGALMILDQDRPGDPRLTGELLRYLSMMFAHQDPLRTFQAIDRLASQMPDSAIAQLGLALSTPHALIQLPADARSAALKRGRQAGRRAHQLAPGFGDVYWPDCTLYSPVRYSQCEAAARQGVAADPDSPFAAASLRNVLVSVGRFREALVYDRMAVAAMPYMAGRLATSAMLLEGIGQTSQAERQFQDTVRWWPDYRLAYADRIRGMLDRGDLAAAAHFSASIPATIDSVNGPGLRELTRAVAEGGTHRVRTQCLGPARDDRLIYACVVAMIRVNDRDGAYFLLNLMFPALVGDTPMEEDRLFLAHVGGFGTSTLSASSLAPIRADPRFIAIAQRVGLINYWRQGRLPDFCTVARESVCRAIRN